MTSEEGLKRALVMSLSEPLAEFALQIDTICETGVNLAFDMGIVKEGTTKNELYECLLSDISELAISLLKDNLEKGIMSIRDEVNQEELEKQIKDLLK